MLVVNQKLTVWKEADRKIASPRDNFQLNYLSARHGFIILNGCTLSVKSVLLRDSLQAASKCHQWQGGGCPLKNLGKMLLLPNFIKMSRCAHLYS
jgi:hypothetical protein